MQKPLRLIMIAFALLIIGAALPFLMVIGLLKSTLFLNFLAVSCSAAGFITGLIGITRYSRPRK